eukprot:g74482.t1
MPTDKISSCPADINCPFPTCQRPFPTCQPQIKRLLEQLFGDINNTTAKHDIFVANLKIKIGPTNCSATTGSCAVSP